jgi:hypothetical protein
MATSVNSVDFEDNLFSRNQIAGVLTPRFQQLIILPTEKCNFRCTYCYEDFLIGKVKEPVLVGIERFLGRRIPELKELALDWFGGEPLMAKNVVLRIAAHAFRRCQDNGVSFRGGLTTNAYVLTPALFPRHHRDQLRGQDFRITDEGRRTEAASGSLFDFQSRHERGCVALVTMAIAGAVTAKPDGPLSGQKPPRWRLLQSPGSTATPRSIQRLFAIFYFEDTFLPAEKVAAFAGLACGQTVSRPQMPRSAFVTRGNVATIPPLPQRLETPLTP